MGYNPCVDRELRKAPTIQKKPSGCVQVLLLLPVSTPLLCCTAPFRFKQGWAYWVLLLHGKGDTFIGSLPVLERHPIILPIQVHAQWEGVLERHTPRLANALDSEEYHLTVMSTLTNKKMLPPTS